MAIDLISMLSDFNHRDDVETQTALFRTRVPWIGEFAYLHIVFKPAGERVLQESIAKLGTPNVVLDFFRRQNGAILFSGALSIYGIHTAGQLLNRTDPFQQLPFNIENENRNAVPPHEHLLAIGGYDFDGATVCIDKRDLTTHLFRRNDSGFLAKTPEMSWDSLDAWITTEVQRLSTMFDMSGRRLVDHRLTVAGAEGIA